jgi:hypothetical protein
MVSNSANCSQTTYSWSWNNRNRDSILGWSEIEICKNQQELWSIKMRKLIKNNFYSTTFQNFECGWPRLGLEDRKNGQKTQKKSVFWIFFIKSWSPKVEYLCLFAASNKTWWEKNNFGYTFVGILSKTLDQKWLLLAKEMFLQRQTLNIQMTLSHLPEQLASWHFDML